MCAIDEDRQFPEEPARRHQRTADCDGLATRISRLLAPAPGSGSQLPAPGSRLRAPGSQLPAPSSRLAPGGPLTADRRTGASSTSGPPLPERRKVPVCAARSPRLSPSVTAEGLLRTIRRGHELHLVRVG